MIEDSGYNDHRVEDQLKELLRLMTGHDCGLGLGGCRQAKRAVSAMKAFLGAEYQRGLLAGRHAEREKMDEEQEKTLARVARHP